MNKVTPFLMFNDQLEEAIEILRGLDSDDSADSADSAEAIGDADDDDAQATDDA
ncbi:MAG: hypothetical protein WCP06_08255 [Verrucomicrobiota bacterium]